MTDVMDKMARLVERLHDRTIEGKIDWIAVNLDQPAERISTSIGENRVSLYFHSYKNISGQGNIDLKISVYNSDGEETDSVRDSQLSKYATSAPNGMHWFQYMKEIHDAAKRQIRRSDETLEDVLNKLG